MLYAYEESGLYILITQCSLSSKGYFTYIEKKESNTATQKTINQWRCSTQSLFDKDKILRFDHSVGMLDCKAVISPYIIYVL